MDTEEAKREAGRWQVELSRAKFEQETQRDKTLVLIVGGALTVSFPVVFGLAEHGLSLPLGWLIAAWVCWILVLILTMLNYTLSIHVYQQAINPLSRGDWAKAREAPWLAKVIEPVNWIVTVLAVAGFVCFSWYAVYALRELRFEQHLPQSWSGSFGLV